MANTASVQKQFTGYHFLAILLAFFGTVILANGALAYFAMSSWSGLVVPNSYVASQNFNQETARRQQAASNGATMQMALARGHVELAFKGRKGESLNVGELNMKVGHPVTAGLARSLRFSQVGLGVYKSTEPLSKGTWIGDISADIEGYGTWVSPVRLVIEE